MNGQGLYRNACLRLTDNILLSCIFAHFLPNYVIISAIFINVIMYFKPTFLGGEQRMGKIDGITHPLWDAFESHLIATNYAENTVMAYRRDLIKFLRWLETYNRPIKTLTRADITDYLTVLTQEGIAPSSRGRKLFAIRSFLQFLAETQQIQGNPAVGIRAPKRDVKRTRVLSEIEYRRLRDVVRKASIRDYAIVELVLQTGLRVSEVCKLKYPHDIEFSNKTVHASLTLRDTLDRTDRLIPLNSVAEKAIQTYIQRRPTDAETDHLFLTNRKTPMSQPLLSRLLKRYYSLANIKAASFHTLRHTFATHSLALGTNIIIIKETLGHKHLTTTEKYLHFIRERQIEELEKNAL